MLTAAGLTAEPAAHADLPSRPWAGKLGRARFNIDSAETLCPSAALADWGEGMDE